MGPPSYMRSVFDRNVVMRRMTVFMMWDMRSGDAKFLVELLRMYVQSWTSTLKKVLFRNVSVLFHEYTTWQPRTSYPCRSKNLHLVGTFAWLNKGTVSFFVSLSVCPFAHSSVCPHETAWLLWTDFREILCYLHEYLSRTFSLVNLVQIKWARYKKTYINL
jgi:hypothetical protein